MRSLAIVVAIACFDASGAAGEVQTNLYIRSLTACVHAKQASKREAVVVIKGMTVGDPAFFYPGPSELGAVRLEYLDTQSLLKRFRHRQRIRFQQSESNR